MNNLYKEIAGRLVQDNQLQRAINGLVPEIASPLIDLLYQRNEILTQHAIQNDEKIEHRDVYYSAYGMLIAEMLIQMEVVDEEKDEAHDALLADTEIEKANYRIDWLNGIIRQCQKLIEGEEGRKKYLQDFIDKGEHEEAVKAFQYNMEHGIVNDAE